MSSMVLDPSASYSLADRYDKLDGQLYLTGVQALVRVLLDRARADRRAGEVTATLVSGYEGSPLGGFDIELGRHADLMSEFAIVHRPGVNEELAATAVSGSQLARHVGRARYSGITGFWYGKAPGLDRATDALRHANLTGADGRGGAVAFVGDDPAAKSSSVPCASESALADLVMPTLFPADAGEVLRHGLHAVELSRVSGLWTALKVTTTVADGGATTDVTSSWRPPHLTDVIGRMAPYGHIPNARLLGAQLVEMERSMHLDRLPMAVEYIRRSGLNVIVGAPQARIGIVAAGSTYLFLRQALDAIGLDEPELSRRGIRLLKLGAIFPLEPTVVAEFADGLTDILVVEDKRSFLEDALKSALYGKPDAPRVAGKRAFDGSPLFSPLGELDADAIETALSVVLPAVAVEVRERPLPRRRTSLTLAARTPFFCSGCPHSSSTHVAEGTLVGAGIGCHAMLLLTPGSRGGEVTGISQMGGEGAQWIGMAPFVEQQHFTQNLGDGTFAHSGSLAVRAAVAAGVNVTFKLLRNSTVAMTGGQHPVGELGIQQLIDSLRAEGVRRVVVTTEDQQRLRRQLGHRADIRSRDELMAVQAELAAVAGVTVLIHDQECAAEKRRKRHRGSAQPPAQRVLINERVCEGCGDCGVKSNCLSVQPVQTAFGRKTRIDQSSCNLDFSCLAGDCPSFITVTPGLSPAHAPTSATPAPGAPEPAPVFSADHFTMRITGIGGTGVVTVSQILATAAVMDGLQVRALDQTGLAQKGGAVVSDLTFSRLPTTASPKVSRGSCDLYLGCDVLVATEGKNLLVTDTDRTVAIISSSQVATGEMISDTTASFPASADLTASIRAATRSQHYLDAVSLANRHLGDEQFANMIMVGAAYQRGALPLSVAALESAIRLNGVAVEANLAAFGHGRAAVASPDSATPERADRVSALGEAALARELAEYQDARYAASFTAFVDEVRRRESELTHTSELTEAVTANLFKLMAYKDEYEVARLSVRPELAGQIKAQFGDRARFAYRLHPPVLRALGMKSKISLGQAFTPLFVALARLKFLRGTPFDPFGRTQVRRTERELIAQYRRTVLFLLEHLTPQSLPATVAIASLPDLIRGYEDVKMANVETYRAQLNVMIGELPTAADQQPSYL